MSVQGAPQGNGVIRDFVEDEMPLKRAHYDEETPLGEARMCETSPWAE